VWDDAALHDQRPWTYGELVIGTAGYVPGRVSFYWQVSSNEDHDWLEFYIDDVRQAHISSSIPYRRSKWNINRHTGKSGTQAVASMGAVQSCFRIAHR
jgi:hypothetical protein